MLDCWCHYLLFLVQIMNVGYMSWVNTGACIHEPVHALLRTRMSLSHSTNWHLCPVVLAWWLFTCHINQFGLGGQAWRQCWFGHYLCFSFLMGLSMVQLHSLRLGGLTTLIVTDSDMDTDAYCLGLMNRGTKKAWLNIEVKERSILSNSPFE